LKLEEISELQNLANNEEKINALNTHLSSIGKRIAETNGSSCLRKNMHTMNTAYTQLSFHPPKASEILKCIKQSSKSNAPGTDGILPNAVKHCGDVFALLLEHLFRICIEQGTFPYVFKSAKVHPLHKGGSKSIDNIRPISIPCFLAKIFEKILVNQINLYFDSAKMINDKQFGFKKGSGTEDAMITLHQFILDALERKLIPVVVLLDLKKAFDTIYRPRLICKLEKAGVRSKSLQLLTSFLTDRRQRVAMNDMMSVEEEVEYGLPQGSILSPILFNFFINDIHNLNDNSLKIQYADDTVVCYTLENLCQLPAVSQNFSNIKDWQHDNNLALNVDKTKLIIFQSRGSTQAQIRVHECTDYLSESCNCPVISSVETVEYLGLTFHHNLKWESQVTKISKKLRVTFETLFTLRSLVDRSLLKTLYYALFESHIRYGLLVYGGATENHLKPLCIMQKRALRTINKLGRIDSPREVFKNNQILNVYALYVFRAVEFLIKHEHFFIDDEMKTHHTRASLNKYKTCPFIKLQISEQSLYYKILKILNSNKSIYAFFGDNRGTNFMKLVKEYLIEQDVDVLKKYL